MKELSIEEKAKAYDEAIKVAQRFYNNSVAITKKGLEDIFPELAESEDERIRKEIISYIKSSGAVTNPIWIAWLEKQGEHANFRNKIQIGDKVTRNEDGVLVNLSQLKRVAKKEEKQGEQKPAEWSEEDNDMLDKVIHRIEQLDHYWNKPTDEKMINWLKSLKPQNKWKPSDEQMDALNYVVNLMASSERPTENDLYYNILKSLRQQLKKLK